MNTEDLENKINEMKLYINHLEHKHNEYNIRWENDQKEKAVLRRQIFKIENSITWKMLRLLDKIKP